MASLPQDSVIRLEKLNGFPLVVIPYPKRLLERIPTGLFILFWLGGWAFGFVVVGGLIISGEAGVFHYFWFGGWSIGGLWAMAITRRIFQGAKDQMLWLNKPKLSLDTGFPAFSYKDANKHPLRSLKSNRVKTELTPNQIETLELRETESGNRLTVDIGAKRVDLAAGAGEIEREWLYDYLMKEYA